MHTENDAHSVSRVTDAFAGLASALEGRYRIERDLGEGGMATVYLAEDLKHHRQVAIKVLKPELAAVLGADRFVREITTTARLQHPNILPLFDSGSAGGFLYYVMPYIEGESLRQRLDRERQLGVEEALQIATEVADALQYAHEHGVVHRDIKPENILVHPGRPVVADFGIALAVSAAAGGRLTETGLSLGTPHYMSPEQATAEKSITNRSDIYSLGAVLYEMLTGDPPHTGRSAQQIIANVVTEVPAPVTRLRPSTPAHVSAAVAKALEKLPADRFETSRAFAEALHNPAFAWSREAAASTAVPAPGRHTAVALLAAFGIVASALAAWGWLRPQRPAPLTQFPTGLTAQLDALTGSAAISPDGNEIVLADTIGGVRQLLLKRRGDPEPVPLAGTKGALSPFFSPDGTWIGFFADRHLFKIPSRGGGRVALSDSAIGGGGPGTWLDDGTIVFDDPSYRLRRVSATGGTSTILPGLPTLGLEALPQALPDARGVLLVGCNDLHCGSSAVYVYDARRDTTRLLFDAAFGAWYVPTGHLLYLTRQGTLLAVSWDDNTLSPRGAPVPILDGIATPNFILSASGTALYVLGRPLFGTGPPPDAEAVWVDRSGHVEPVDPAWHFNVGPGENWGLALSPDGSRLALRLATDLGNNIWIRQLPTGLLSRLTFYSGEHRSPAWSPDGRMVTFISERPTATDSVPGPHRFNLWSRPSDGTGDAAVLWQGPEAFETGFWTPDGKWLVLEALNLTGAGGKQKILAVRPGTDSVARKLPATDYDESAPAISPDSRWIAYLSDETGANEVFVRPFPDAEHGKWQVSNGGGSAPLWAHHGHELFYWARDSMMTVTIHPGPPFRNDPPRFLFTRPAGVRAGSRFTGHMDLTPDDRRFIMVRDAAPAVTGRKATLIMAQNLFEVLRAKMRE